MSEENKLIISSGATPLTVADAVIRECSDQDWLEDIVFYLQCFLLRAYDTAEPWANRKTSRKEVTGEGKESGYE